MAAMLTAVRPHSSPVARSNSKKAIRPHRTICRAASPGEGSASQVLKQSLQAAKHNLAQGTSPGAGLSSPEEQAEAAYADLLLTSMGSEEADALTNEELQSLQKGGNMQKEDVSQKGGLGLLGLFQALTGGAHIVRQSDGRI